MKLLSGGWRQSAFFFSLAASVVLIINLSFTLWALLSNHVQDGIGIMASGSCSHMRNIDTGIHLAINILGTVLLAGSNYTMQCVSAPTRAQIDAAHKRSSWLDIGVPSFRNVGSLSRWSKALWFLLGASSLPLHLFYNSVVFSSISANVYRVYPVNEAYLSPSGPGVTNLDKNLTLLLEDFHQGRLQQLSPAECIDAYARPFQSAWGDLLLVANNATFGKSTLPLGGSSLMSLGHGNECHFKQSYQWICAQLDDPELRCNLPCDETLSQIRSMTDRWSPFGAVIEDCYAAPTAETCSLEFSTSLCWVVVALNLFKAVLMAVVAFRGSEKPLLTIGDAVASFLEVPDETTPDMCLATRKQFPHLGMEWLACPPQFDDKVKRRSAAASSGRWTTVIILYMVALLACICLLAFGISTMPGKTDISTLAALGLGTLSENTVMSTPLTPTNHQSISPGAALLGNVMMANSPQLILSALYFAYNGIFTSMCMATEWSRFSTARKGLRVSSKPQCSQRSTYFLQLPYRYSLPLILFSLILHWLISQSLFLIKVEAFPASEAFWGNTFTTCGWSPLGVICTILVGAFIVCFLVYCGRRPLPTAMPIAGSCSAAISAACHPQQDEGRAWEEPLQWGVVGASGTEFTHCSFSSRDVSFPEHSKEYY